MLQRFRIVFASNISLSEVPCCLENALLLVLLGLEVV